jgi:hypothetical protein
MRMVLYRKSAVVRCSLWCSCFDPPSFPLPIGASVGSLSFPAEVLHCRSNPVLIGFPDPRRVHVQPLLRDLPDRSSGHCLEIGSNRLFPDVGFVSLRLLWNDVHSLEILIRPPRLAGAISNDCFGKHLIAIASEFVRGDNPSSDRPEPAAAGLVAQIPVAIGGANEDTLA